MKHPTFTTALAGAALAAGPAAAAPVRFDGPIPSDAVIRFDLTTPHPSPHTISPSTFVLERYRAGGQNYVTLRSSMETPGSGIATSLVGANTVIDASLDWWASGQPVWATLVLLQIDLVGDPGNISLLDVGASGFAALSFDSSDGTHYGWVELRNISVPDAKSWRYEILAWGYETEAGVGIAAGAVPAPGALTLLGGVGVLAGRRRR